MQKLENGYNLSKWKPWMTAVGFIYSFFGVFMFWGHTTQNTGITVLLLLHITFLGVAAFIRKKPSWSFIFVVLSLSAAVTSIFISNLGIAAVTFIAFNSIVYVALIFRNPIFPFLFGITMGATYFLQDPSSLDNVSQAIGCVYSGTSLGLFIFLIQKLYQERNKYYIASITDSLTNTYSFDHVIKIGQKLLEQGKEIELLLIDVDDFKVINDRHGHIAGNEVLIHISQFLRTMTGEGGYVGRLGGDEFVIIAEQKALPSDFSARLANGIRSYRFSSIHTIKSLDISISIGTASSQEDDIRNINELLHKADMEMYDKKKISKQSTELC